MAQTWTKHNQHGLLFNAMATIEPLAVGRWDSSSGEWQSADYSGYLPTSADIFQYFNSQDVYSGAYWLTKALASASKMQPRKSAIWHSPFEDPISALLSESLAL